MGSLNKEVLRSFIESECPRRLFWELGEDDPAWMREPRKHLLRESLRLHEPATQLGKDYERLVYEHALQDPRRVLAARGRSRDQALPSTPLTPALLLSLTETLQTQPELGFMLLLEHGWSVSERLWTDLFDLPHDARAPVQSPGQEVRPDMLLLQRPAPDEPRQAIDHEGRLIALDRDDLRCGLRVFDIKHTSEHSVGKKHFIELIFYARALALWLVEQGLKERAVVLADGHGIIPHLSSLGPSLTLDALLHEHAITTRWIECSPLWDQLERAARALYDARPTRVEDVELRLQPSCGYCAFERDCAQSLMGQGADRSSWDLRLLPTTSSDTASMLRAWGYQTLAQLDAQLLDDARVDQGPLYAEAPLLALKAKALLVDQPLPATPEHMGPHQSRFSIACPRAVDTCVFLDLEADPTQERVFALGVHLTSRLRQGSPETALAPAAQRWWSAWQRALERAPKPGDLPALRRSAAQLVDELGLDSPRPQDQDDPLATEGEDADDPARPSRRAVQEQIALALDTLRQHGDLEFKPDDRGGCRLEYTFCEVCLDDQPASERALAALAAKVLHAIILLCQGVEQTLSITRQRQLPWQDTPQPFTYSPDSAFFYWSSEQLEHIASLVERHLHALLDSQRDAPPIEHLLRWLAPADSGVRHAEQHTKLFNLRDVVESTTGQPHVINVTWHALDEARRLRYARQLAQAQGRPAPHTVAPADRVFWAEHFNHMDSAVWHRMRQERTSTRFFQLADELRKQLTKKLVALRMIWQDLSQEALREPRLDVKPKSTAELLQDRPEPWHPVARAWAMQARLEGAQQALRADHIRHDYPARSIAKLHAAEVTDLRLCSPAPDGKPRFGLTLRGRGQDARLSQGDHVALVWEQARRWASTSALQAEITSMIYDDALPGYHVELTQTPQSKLLERLRSYDVLRSQPPLYLYPVGSDLWSGRLADGRQSFLQAREQRLGVSWLGYRLAALAQLGPPAPMPPPPDQPLTLSAQEVLLYAPALLPSDQLQGPLRTTTWPAPDPSQQRAIRAALGSAVTCIQGPPGTGKSQTIAALIDEAFERAQDAPLRVLVMAASYDAMAVLSDKLRRQRGPDSPTRAAQIRQLFMRSRSRDPVMPDVPGLPHVVDVALWTQGSTPKLIIDGQELQLGRQRLEDVALSAQCVVFANAFTCAQLIKRRPDKNKTPIFFHESFGFDLIIIDEASQLQASALCAAALLSLDAPMTLSFEQGRPHDWDNPDLTRLKAMSAQPLTPSPQTRWVIVGDQHQLAPVQIMEPPRRLRKVLTSAFDYMLQAHELPAHQLQINYRSHQDIVEYTKRLGLYHGLEAAHLRRPLEPLAPCPDDLEPAWTRGVLAPELAVHALIHDRQHEASLSPLEAKLVVDLILAFYRQLQPQTPEQELDFWEDKVGVVSPHNAQGTRIINMLRVALRGVTHLDAERLDRALRQTIYSVEKFQGSDRALIIGSMGVSSVDQLRAEERFIYGLNRFNVLTSRARQKVILLCSRAYLDYIPSDRHVQAAAARIRSFALDLCDQRRELDVFDERGDALTLSWRWFTSHRPCAEDPPAP